MAPDTSKISTEGEKIIFENGKLFVPDYPLLPFIEGDGAGADIWEVAVQVLDAAVYKIYGENKKLVWMKIPAVEKTKTANSSASMLSQRVLEIIQENHIVIKGQVTTSAPDNSPSLSEILLSRLDLYAHVKPVRYFTGIPSAVKKPENINMMVFQESTEDMHPGIEFLANSMAAKKVKMLLEEEGLLENIRFPETASIGIKSVSREGSYRIMRAAIRYATQNNRSSVCIVHRGNIQKATEGSFLRWCYELAKDEFNQETIFREECGGNPPKGKILIKDVLVDDFLQQIIVRPADYDVIAAMHLNGDYISRILAAQVGGIEFVPSAYINYETGHAVFEALHCAAAKYAGLDKVNPLSVILTGSMMLRHIGWEKVSEKIELAIEKTLSQKTVTYDLARVMNGARQVKCSEFGDAIISNL